MNEMMVGGLKRRVHARSFVAAGQRSVREDSGTTVWIWGEHDVSTADALRRFLCDQTATDDSDTDVVVDVSGVTFIDASTLGVLIQASHMRSNRSFRLTASPPVVRRLLCCCNLDETLRSASPPALSANAIH